MSYILDAIKKSDAERGHGSIPGLQTVHSSSLNYKTGDRQIWPYILIGLLLLNFAGLILYFTRTDNSVTIPVASSNHTDNTQTLTYVEPTKSQPTPTQTINRPTTTAITQQSNNTSAEPATTEPTVEIEQTQANNEVLDIEDLPGDIKQHIPSMIFTGHVYSSSVIQRSIIINDSFMEEGDALNNDVTLAEITSKGAVFDYQGILFEVNILTGWNVN